MHLLSLIIVFFRGREGRILLNKKAGSLHETVSYSFLNSLDVALEQMYKSSQ